MVPQPVAPLAVLCCVLEERQREKRHSRVGAGRGGRRPSHHAGRPHTPSERHLAWGLWRRRGGEAANAGSSGECCVVPWLSGQEEKEEEEVEMEMQGRVAARYLLSNQTGADLHCTCYTPHAAVCVVGGTAVLHYIAG